MHMLGDGMKQFLSSHNKTSHVPLPFSHLLDSSTFRCFVFLSRSLNPSRWAFLQSLSEDTSEHLPCGPHDLEEAAAMG